MSTTTRLLQLALLAAACLLLHLQNFDHEFLLDSGHGLVANEAVRNLKNIPQYFTDPSTLTSLRQNWDYRPVLQITFALNYWISGYSMWSWHLFQILLHYASVVGLLFLCPRVLAEFKPDEDKKLHHTIAFVAALLFAIHPYTSGVVNYLWARSSLLTAAFLLYSFILYTADSRNKPMMRCAAVILYTLALFTKVEAVAAIGAYWLFEVITQGVQVRNAVPRVQRNVWHQFGNGFIGDVVRSLNLTTLKRLFPFILITCVYAFVRVMVVPDFLSQSRHSGDVNSYVYFITQLTVWWSYILNWFAPVNLIADNLAYPVFRSIAQPEVLLALSGWLVIALILTGCYRTHPEYMFLSITALALISPTSSILPLAEMMNEHRPYLPVAILSLVWVSAAGRWASTSISTNKLSKGQVYLVLLAVVATLSFATLARNKVYATSESYWSDILQKAPSSRAHVNYGLEMRKQGFSEKAMHHFQEALTMAPYWHVIHINLAIGYEDSGLIEKARYHYDSAVQYEQYGSTALEYRGNFHLRSGEYIKAVADLENSLALATDSYPIYKGVAIGSAASGDWQKSVSMTERMCALKSPDCEYEIVDIATPFWQDSFLYPRGILYFQGIEQFLPQRWWIQQNIAELAYMTGNYELAQRSSEKAELYRNRPEAALSK